MSGRSDSCLQSLDRKSNNVFFSTPISRSTSLTTKVQCTLELHKYHDNFGATPHYEREKPKTLHAKLGRYCWFHLTSNERGVSVSVCVYLYKYCWYHLTSKERGLSVSLCICLYKYRRVLVLVCWVVTLHMLTLHAHAHSKWGEINSISVDLK